MDCYVQYRNEIFRGYEYLHYAVTDIWNSSYFNAARGYEFRGRVEQPAWLRPHLRAPL